MRNRFAVILLVLNLVAISGFNLIPNPQVLGEETQTTTVTYSLLIGWNLVHFPVKPDNFSTASELVKTVAQAGGYVTTIATWDNGAWKEYIQRGSTAYSEDFAIVPGRAYFLRSHEQHDWVVTGTPIQVSTLALKPGWNSIGLTASPDTNAVNILDALNTSNVERANEIDSWLSGTWQVFVKRIYSQTDIQEYGDNFALTPTSGYMLKSNDYLQLKLEN